ncbi:prolyl-tRNA synthetase associated domain-containing protein [Pleionea sediminis]|uniref:prolyl-tRNA synthetase associated domain-containing protein n=1 Tax=Pleionea sediminis TaxID=2569479 RepID=UPI001184ECD0|nr:prolyl-tRNA synthetase associated domain-containing protein [Pleionea sediminis]
MTVEKLNSVLAELEVEYHKYSHPPLHSCDEADRLELKRSGQRLKNLFLKDNYGRRHFLLVVSPDKKVDLKQLSRQLNIARLGFASERRLDKYLKVKPGCVSILSLLNDESSSVEFWIDKEVASAELFQCHPFINTQTYILSRADAKKFVEYTNHRWEELDIPSIMTKEENFD